MRKNYFLIGMLAIVSMLFAACSNDDLPTEEPTGTGGTDEVVEGVPTYARFTFKLDAVETRATGDFEGGTANEKLVKNIHVYVFKNGVFEASSKNGAVSTNSSNVYHSEVLNLTSGLKTILLVANMGTGWITPPTAGTTLASFQEQLMNLYTTPGRLAHDSDKAVTRVGDGWKNLQGGDKPADNGFLMTNYLKDAEFTLKPGISQADASKDSYPGQVAEDYNHFDIKLYRATAKLQTTYTDAGALKYMAVLDGNLSNQVEIGELTDSKFSVRNLPKDVYLFEHSTANDPLKTPWYAATGTASTWTDFKKYYDEINEPNLTVAVKSATPSTIYIPENANAVPAIGNTTYVLVKGVFKPNKDYVVTDIDSDGKEVYGFKGLKDDITAFTNAPAWGATIYAVPNSVTGAAAREKHALATTLKAYLAKVGLVTYIGKDKDNPVYDGVLGKSVYYSSEMGTAAGIYNTVNILKNVGSGSTWEKTIVETVKYLQYTGGVTYYRINIQDNRYPEQNNLYYSVTRNNFYQVNIKSISGLGYPNAGDVTIEPNDPISQMTHMQAHITIEPWKVIEQEADLN